ncbi:hypothetical protein K7X08_027568 [Anisodus acutangulus]|uniref:BHLH domain-containing protein n=1 Tax=Anisodus acutangulus TaxID=402998 RepID=A0A9Q1MMN9_9SOLA|nr:hypothetical protein K7X08_027568 [Anisodus acutangulus]
MESVGAFFDEEYCQSLSRMFLSENSDFMFQLHGDEHQSDNIIEGSFLSSPNCHTLNCNLEYFSQENSIDNSGSDGMFFLNNTSHDQYLQHNNESTDFYMMGHKNLEKSTLNQVSHDDYNSQLDNEMLLKRKFDEVELQSVAEDQKFKNSENPKKKSRVSKDVTNCESGQSTSSCSSEDDSNGGTDLKTKTRASRGAATDPQSLYARKRRERINERLKILQSLVPNGTKVDISTMLEEAVHYVKFLQLQIKLLSSDDMWMYSPIAYNGMRIDLSHT